MRKKCTNYLKFDDVLFNNLHARAPSPKSLWIVPGAGHNDLYSHAPAAYEARFTAFLHSLR